MPITNKQRNLHLRSLRIAYLITILFTIFLGLASRGLGHLTPVLIAQNAGDILWAMMVYFGFRFLFMQRCLGTAILLSFTFCFSIEFSQLYQEDWINDIRSTTIGGLILGKGFLVIDLVRYSIGIFIGALFDRLGLKAKGRFS